MAKVKVYSPDHYSHGAYISLPSGYLDIYTPAEFVNNVRLQKLPSDCQDIHYEKLPRSDDPYATYRPEKEKLHPIDTKATRFFSSIVHKKVYNANQKPEIQKTTTFDDVFEVFYEESKKFLEDFGDGAKVVRFGVTSGTARYFFFKDDDWQLFIKDCEKQPLDRYGNIICFNEQRSLKVFEVRGYLL